jgi:selenocysteine lyase/cysteine desulfurase
VSPIHQAALEAIQAVSHRAHPDQLANDEEFWKLIGEQFSRPADFIHLEYGFYHPTCHAVLEEEIATLRSNQQLGSYYKRTAWKADYEQARTELAAVAGVSPEEIILTRNTTESLNIVIQGLPLEAGDEVVHSDQDYPSLDEAWEQRAQREGLVLRKIRVPLNPASDQEVVDAFAAGITSRTRVLHLTHLIHWTGQVLPIQALCALGRQRGLQVLVDAAHSFAQLPFQIPALDCDYFAASLHKWMGAPLTLGFLYLRRSRIPCVRPLIADVRVPADDIRKLEHFGNRADTAHRGLRVAIAWHQAITTPVKAARLRRLQRRWTEQVRSLPRVRMLTPRDVTRHGAIGTFTIEGIPASVVAEKLFREFGIFVNATGHAEFPAVRATVGLPTTTEDVDRFAEAIEAIAC